jgi:hypothetical protein
MRAGHVSVVFGDAVHPGDYPTREALILLKIRFLSLSLSSCARRPNKILLPTFLLLMQVEVINYKSAEYAVFYSDTYAAYTSHTICSETNNESVY